MKIEVCVGTLEAARIVSEQSIDRIETCIALEQGGLTPSKAMVSWIHNTFHLEQHVLVRLRAGGFNYSYDEIVVMRDQITNLKDSGAKGFVVGALTDQGDVHTEAISIWKRAAPDFDFTFHRAFDSTSNWRKAMDELIKLGFKRILTSGFAKTVKDGLSELQAMKSYADGRIEIMAGGGVNGELIESLKATGIDAIHFSGTIEQVVDPYSPFAEKLLVPNEEKISTLVKQIRG